MGRFSRLETGSPARKHHDKPRVSNCLHVLWSLRTFIQAPAPVVMSEPGLGGYDLGCDCPACRPSRGHPTGTVPSPPSPTSTHTPQGTASGSRRPAPDSGGQTDPPALRLVLGLTGWLLVHSPPGWKIQVCVRTCMCTRVGGVCVRVHALYCGHACMCTCAYTCLLCVQLSV